MLVVLAYAAFGLSEVIFWSMKGSLFYALMVFLLMGWCLVGEDAGARTDGKLAGGTAVGATVDATAGATAGATADATVNATAGATVNATAGASSGTVEAGQARPGPVSAEP